MRLIDADAMYDNWLENGENECVYDTNTVLFSIDEQPTIDAIPVELAAQILCDAFGDECPCNYNDIDTWLPMLCGSENCLNQDDPLYCWKQYIKHHGEREERI